MLATPRRFGQGRIQAVVSWRPLARMGRLKSQSCPARLGVHNRVSTSFAARSGHLEAQDAAVKVRKGVEEG